MSRIRLTWNNASTTIVEQRVYRSISPFDIDDMPAPLAVLPRRSREYLDSTIEDGLAYYYAVSSVLPDYSELISEEIKVEASPVEGDPYWDNVVALLHFDGSLADKAGASWNTPPVTYFDGLFGQAARVAPNYSLLSTNSLGSQDFTVEVAYKGSLAGTSARYPEIFSFGSSWGAGFVGVYTNRNDTGNKLSAYVYGKPTIIADVDVNDAVFHRIALVRNNNTLLLFCDGVLVGVTDISGVTVSNFTRVLGVGQNSIDCLLDEFRFTEGVARYTENFTPPTKPFPNN